MAEPFVLYDRADDIVWLTLNRPERLNAVHLGMRDELWTMLTLVRDDPTVRAVVLRGAGERAFSAGADILEFGTAPGLVQSRDARLQRDLWATMSQLRMPLIAALHGFAFGAGLEMSLYCDLRVASDDAQFGLPEVSLGYLPSAGGSQTLPRHVARSEALRLATTGAPLTAAEALDRGLVHRVVPHGDLERTVRELAQRLASYSPEALAATKRAVIEGIDLSLVDGLALERRLAAIVA
jgi:enoyl-CoA hydratase/carnithine racemase